MAGKNLGKKYIYLDGTEVPTPQNSERGRLYLLWAADNRETIKRAKLRRPPCEDNVSDAIVKVWEAVALKGYDVKDYLGYTLSTLRNIERAEHLVREKFPHESLTVGLEQLEAAEEAYKMEAKLYKQLAESYAVDAEFTERPTHELEREIIEYVLRKYPRSQGNIFVLWFALAPAVSFHWICKQFGISYYKYKPDNDTIREDVKKKFLVSC